MACTVLHHIAINRIINLPDQEMLPEVEEDNVGTDYKFVDSVPIPMITNAVASQLITLKSGMT